jgi:hypothetical protein
MIWKQDNSLRAKVRRFWRNNWKLVAGAMAFHVLFILSILL